LIFVLTQKFFYDGRKKDILVIQQAGFIPPFWQFRWAVIHYRVGLKIYDPLTMAQRPGLLPSLAESRALVDSQHRP
jgi:hypothetical protein